MYIQKETKDNIQDYKVIKDNFYYKIKNTDYNLYQNDILIDNENYGFFFFENFYGLNHKNSTDLIGIVSNEKITIPVTFVGNGVYENNFVVSKNLNREGIGLYSVNYTICQLFPFKELYTLPYRYYGSGYRHKNHYIQLQNEKKTLKSLSLLTGKYEWELDLSSRKNPEGSRDVEAQIGQLVGVWENQLILTMSNGELVSVDTQTGNILWETQQLETQINQGPPHKWRGHLSFNGCHIENGELYEMVGSVYYCIDLTSQAVEILWQDQRTEEYVTVQHRTYTEDYIYFTGSLNGAFQPHIIGVFNRKTLSLEWVEDMNLPVLPSMGYSPSLNQAPQVDGNKLYVLDSGGTLHIFEKEEN